ncbi:MAG: hypothetical protein S4CHLAM45_13560 [Chlamydiales bacterium]|nr:hypothetical protein [Chlamydiales bacterium]MCH9620460.1 hypothetical protein [Chlamydiales bacterium]MCH9623446.1 hypothetical protein [Chlamydiales bacterium]
MKQHRWLRQSYWGVVQGENFLGQIFLLIIRLYWGGQLLFIGLSKWSNLSETADSFTLLHIPSPLFSAWLAGTIEFFGGISLLLGLFSRVTTPLLILFFMIAYATAHPEALNALFSNPDLFTSEHPFLFLFTSIVIFSFGSGFFSFDYWVEKTIYGKKL